MGLYFRRSKKIGPFRISLSKRGVSASLGIPGLRLTRGPRGTYVTSSFGGMTYRKRLDTSAPAEYPVRQPSPLPRPENAQDLPSPMPQPDSAGTSGHVIHRGARRVVLLYILFVFIIALIISPLTGEVRHVAIILFGLYLFVAGPVLMIWSRAKERSVNE